MRLPGLRSRSFRIVLRSRFRAFAARRHARVPGTGWVLRLTLVWLGSPRLRKQLRLTRALASLADGRTGDEIGEFTDVWGHPLQRSSGSPTDMRRSRG